jgi:hypothetical protein
VRERERERERERRRGNREREKERAKDGKRERLFKEYFKTGVDGLVGLVPKSGWVVCKGL